MWLLIGVCASVLILGLIGHTYPRLNNYPSPSSYQPLPDLRVSVYAPDFFLALDTVRAYKDKEREIPNPLKGYKKPQQPNYYEIL